MKLSVEVTVPEYTTILSIDESDRMTDGTHEVFIPESKQTVEINLDDLDLDSLEEYVQKESESTLIDDDRLEFIEEFEYVFNDLIECFEKHSLNKIKRQQVIQNVIDQLNGK